MDGTLVVAVDIDQRIPAGAAIQSVHTGLANVGHTEVGVQGQHEAQRCGAGVIHRHIERQAATSQRERQLQAKVMRPERQRGRVAVQGERQLHRTVLGCRVARHPGLVARKPVFRQRSAFVELRETHRHTAADGRAAIEGTARA